LKALTATASIQLEHKRDPAAYVHCYSQLAEEHADHESYRLLGAALMRIQEPEKAIKVRLCPQSCSLLCHTAQAWPHLVVADLLFSFSPLCSSALLVKIVRSRLIWCCLCIVNCLLATPCNNLPCSYLDLPCLGLLSLTKQYKARLKEAVQGLAR